MDNADIAYEIMCAGASVALALSATCRAFRARLARDFRAILPDALHKAWEERARFAPLLHEAAERDRASTPGMIVTGRWARVWLAAALIAAAPTPTLLVAPEPMCAQWLADLSAFRTLAPRIIRTIDGGRGTPINPTRDEGRSDPVSSEHEGQGTPEHEGNEAKGARSAIIGYLALSRQYGAARHFRRYLLDDCHAFCTTTFVRKSAKLWHEFLAPLGAAGARTGHRGRRTEPLLAELPALWFLTATPVLEAQPLLTRPDDILEALEEDANIIEHPIPTDIGMNAGEFAAALQAYDDGDFWLGHYELSRLVGARLGETKCLYDFIKLDCRAKDTALFAALKERLENDIPKVAVVGCASRSISQDWGIAPGTFVYFAGRSTKAVAQLKKALCDPTVRVIFTEMHGYDGATFGGVAHVLLERRVEGDERRRLLGSFPARPLHLWYPVCNKEQIAQYVSERWYVPIRQWFQPPPTHPRQLLADLYKRRATLLRSAQLWRLLDALCAIYQLSQNDLRKLMPEPWKDEHIPTFVGSGDRVFP